MTGERPEEPTDMKKQKKLQRRKSVDKEELNVACRSLGKADHEGWLYRKGRFFFIFLTELKVVERKFSKISF